jgi:hypothetical protein
MPKHPETAAGEVLIGNMFASDFRHVGWQSKRLGKTAYHVSGKRMPSFRPVFVTQRELEAAGIEITPTGPLDHRW